MRPWQVTLESIMMLLLWAGNAGGDTVICCGLIFLHDYGGYVMLGVLGAMHFLLNGWILRFQWRKMNKCLLIVLFLTQTAALAMVARRAWRSLTPYCTRDEREKKRKVLIAKYSLCCETWNSSKKFPTEGNTVTLKSCIPAEVIANANHINTVTDSSTDVENNSILDQLFKDEEDSSQQIIPMGTTKYAEDTYNIELNFNTQQEFYVGEPSILKFLMRTLHLLFIEEKKISYHIVTDSRNKILHITKSDRHIKNLPSRILPGQTTTLCNDVHYALNLAKGTGYEIFALTKRTYDENKFFVDTDVSKFLWSLVWPSAVVKLYTILDILEGKRARGHYMILFVSPLLSVITWLLTNKGVSEPWKNVGLMIPLRIFLTVSRTFLVIGIGVSSLILGAACYLSVKAVGLVTLTAYLAYTKKYKNVELYTDEIDRYTYSPLCDPVIQFSESCVYMAWSIWYYATTPRVLSRLSYYHLPLFLFLSTLLGHVFGLTWLWFTRSNFKKPLKDPKSVLRLVQSLECIRT